MDFKNVIIAAILGFFITSTVIILYRAANLLTTKLEINAMSYATPVITLIYLGILGYINVPHIDWLIIGTTGILASNILLNVNLEMKMTHQYLTATIWICGVASYFYINKYIL